MRKLLFPLLLLVASGCAMLGMEDKPRLAVVESGIFRNGRLATATAGIPRELGVTFGYRFKVVDPKAPTMKARIVTATPGLLEPGKDKVQRDYVSTLTIEPGQQYDLLFTFSETWEMATGPWELRVETDKGDVLSQTFTVYEPGKIQ